MLLKFRKQVRLCILIRDEKIVIFFKKVFQKVELFVKINYRRQKTVRSLREKTRFFSVRFVIYAVSEEVVK